MSTAVEGMPLTPYAGTSGWSGSDTSRERAEREDIGGVTTERQSTTLALLATGGLNGMTWKEVSDRTGWHHGQSSGALSVLHKEGFIARLTDRRLRCQIYVLPEMVAGRETAAHRDNRTGVGGANAAEVVAAEYLLHARDCLLMTSAEQDALTTVINAVLRMR